MTYTLGISAFYHDSAAVLLKDDHIIAAFQEERFTRVKQDNSFPVNAIKHCLAEGKITLNEVDLFSYYEDPELKFQRIIKTHRKYFPKKICSFLCSLPKYRNRKKIIKRIKRSFRKHFEFNANQILCQQHHASHAASAFFASPFEQAAILCIDGVGEWDTVTAWQGKGTSMTPLWQIKFPHSLGLLYSAFTQFCGFKVDSGEYKLMGLAPYGEPLYADIIMQHLIHIQPNGHFTLDMSYFDYETGNSMINDKFCQLFDGPAREPEGKITHREMNLAASIQQVTERVVLLLAETLKQQTQCEQICLAGGVALNCVANGKLIKQDIFKNTWIQPAAGDAGTALGAAYLAYYHRMQPTSARAWCKQSADAMQGAYIGNQYTNNEIKSQLNQFNACYQQHTKTELISITAHLLQRGLVIGWHQGRMEFGPRALGARSILGNPQKADMQSVMNLKIKNRESFRPFAPAVLAEQANQWFDLECSSPYMLLVAGINKQQRHPINITERGLNRLKARRSTIPAVTHVDYSARVQTVDGKHNPLFHQLLHSFHQLSDCPVLINTSFNVRGEPIVESPADAYRCFMRTAMDYLIIGDFILDKKDQPDWKEDTDWRNIYELD